MNDVFAYKGKRVVVTGGLGFLGSNLAVRLVKLGARVTIIDSSIPGCGANPQNIRPIQDLVRLIPLDISQAAEYADELRGSDFIFNLAGEISHTRSMEAPLRDMEINAIAQLRFLLALRKACPGVRVVFASTRQVYGRPLYLPVDEAHPVQAIDFNGIHKLAAAQHHLMLSRLGDLDAVVVRLTNVYGPRMALCFTWQGFLGVFARAALLGNPLDVFGDGAQLRDPAYVDDVVSAFLAAGAVDSLPSRIYNVGGPEPVSLGEIAGTFARAAGSEVRYRPFPEARKGIDIGSYYTDCRLIERELGWRPETRLADGVRRTLAYYRPLLENYLDPQVVEGLGGAAVPATQLSFAAAQ